MGVLVSDAPETVSAARFTSNARVGAPIVVSRQARTDGLRAVVANAAHSNVGDGRRGLETAVAMQATAAEALGVEADRVAVASTGVIGTELPREPVLAGVRAAAARLGEDAATFSEAIMTSDRAPKRACLEVALPGGTVRLSAQAKGAGMISPRHATMFCFVQTDALAHARDRGPAHRGVREALLRPHHGGRPALDERHGGGAGRRRVRRGGGARDRGRDRPGRGARRADAPARARDRGRRRGHGADRAGDRARARTRPWRPWPARWRTPLS